MSTSAVAAAKEFRVSTRNAIPSMSAATLSGGKLLELAVAAEMEEWRPVAGWPGYEISSLGRLGSWVPRKPGIADLNERKILTGGHDRDGYRRAVLCRPNGERKSIKIHHMVLGAFRGPRPLGYVTRHLNGVRTDNRASNLEWSTQKDNIADKRRHGTWQEGEKHGNATMREEQVRYIRSSTKTARELADELGVGKSAVYMARKGISWRHVPMGRPNPAESPPLFAGMEQP